MGGEQCPYDLVWSEVAKKCGTPCPPPYYSDAENTTSYIVGMILGWTGFLGCYFYCMTALFRPIMIKFPNSTVFFLHFSGATLAFGHLYSLLLVEEIECSHKSIYDSTPTTLCKVSSGIIFYSGLSILLWMLCYMVTMAMRLSYMRMTPVRLRIMKWSFFVISYFSWSFICTLVSIVMEYEYILFGGFMCLPISSSNFNIVATYCFVFLMTSIFCILIFYSSYRLLKLRQMHRTPFRVLILKQVRLYAMWAYLLSACATYISLVFLSISSVPSVQDILDGLTDYETCVALGHDDCTLDLHQLPFGLNFTTVLLFRGSPLAIFVILGFRVNLLEFWIEYFKHVWKTKRLTLSYQFEGDSTTSRPVN